MEAFPAEFVPAHIASFSCAGLRVILALPTGHSHTLYIIERPTFVFPPLSVAQPFSTAQVPHHARSNVPTLNEWKALWRAWDTVTLRMIPQEMLHEKPIDLRHKCLFYIGHIPT